MVILSTLSELLSQQGLKLKRTTPGHTENGLLCPKCGGGRTKEKSLNVTIDQDGQGFAWVCHRGSCADSGGVRTNTETKERRAKEKIFKTPEAHKATPRPAELLKWFADRGISQKTVEHFGVYQLTKAMPGDAGVLKCMVMPYVWQGVITNRKYRALAQKHPMMQEKDARPTLYNADVLLAAPPHDAIVFVEGEWDALACHEAGWPGVVSVPMGASEGTLDGKLEALEAHAEQLARVKRFILAGDDDGPGKHLMDELGRRLGRHRCWIAKWPDDCKDANDVLVKHGPGTLFWALKEAEPYPISGLQYIKPGKTIRDWLGQPAPALMTCGTYQLDQKLHLPTDGRLIVITGIPSHGKTAWATFAMINVMAKHDRRFAVFSPEMQPWEDYVARCIEIKARAPLTSSKYAQAMPIEQAEQVEEWLSTRLVMLTCDAADESPTLDWLLERAEAAIIRFGITDLEIDPWNELDHARGLLERDEYVSKCLHRLKHWAQRFGCNVWIIAHPVKLSPPKPGSAMPMPTLYDVKGGSEWYDKTDVGLCVHRPENITKLVILKAKFAAYGKRGDEVELNFDIQTGCYSDAALADLDEPISQDMWQNR